MTLFGLRMPKGGWFRVVLMIVGLAALCAAIWFGWPHVIANRPKQVAASAIS